MIKVIKPKKPIQKYSTTCHKCKAELTFDESDARSITDEGQRRTFDVITCPECNTDISSWLWEKLK
jgi:uncharacterized protein with PIN domain